MRLVRTGVALLAVLIACGGGSGTAKDAKSGGGDVASELEKRHAEYTKECVSDASMNDFCSCSWSVMREHATDQELATNQFKGDPEARQNEISTATAKKCGDKFPEPVLREKFVASCSKDDPSLSSFCGCLLSELTKVLTRAQLTDIEHARSPARAAANREAAKHCSDKVPEEDVHKGFVQGCLKQPSYTSYCECVWKAFRAKLSLGEMIVLDDETQGPIIEESATSCDSKRPK
jgi:hypothetical protein